jgi:hypothetical protein
MKSVVSFVALLGIGMLAAGCAGGGSDEDVASGDEAVSAAPAGPSSKIDFHCSTHPSSQNMDISLFHKDLEWDDGTKGELDPTYRPTAANKHFVRYLGFATSEGSATMLVDKALLDGDKGTVKLQWTGESFSQQTFTCEAK